MYGTILRAKTKPGQRDAFLEAMRDRGTAERNPGFLSAEVCTEDKDPNGVVVVIRFRDRDSYMKNAERPETDADYQKMVQYLQGAPEWIDVNYVEFHGEPVSEQSTAAAR